MGTESPGAARTLTRARESLHEAAQLMREAAAELEAATLQRHNRGEALTGVDRELPGGLRDCAHSLGQVASVLNLTGELLGGRRHDSTD